jgi:hypothetical protein
MLPLVAFHDELMGTRYKKQSIDLGKLLRNILTKRVTSSPRRNAPATSAKAKRYNMLDPFERMRICCGMISLPAYIPVIWIGPDKVTHRAFVGHFLNAIEFTRVV